MARGRPRTAETNSLTNLKAALEFVAAGTKQIGETYAQQIVLWDKCAYVYNGYVAIAHPIDEDVRICVNYAKLSSALKQCGSTGTLTQTPKGGLTVKSGAYKAHVPEFDVSLMPPIAPDTNIASLDDRIKVGFGTIGSIIQEAAPTMLCASLLLTNGVMYVTNRAVLFEYWHGNSLPPDLVLTKGFVDAVSKCDKSIIGFGFSEGSVTFHLEGGAWIRGNRYRENWPDITQIFNCDQEPTFVDVPIKLFDAVKSIQPFVSDDGAVYFTTDRVTTSIHEGTGAEHIVRGLPHGPSYLAKHLLSIAGKATKIAWDATPDKSLFYAENVRGAIAKNFKQADKIEPDPATTMPNTMIDEADYDPLKAGKETFDDGPALLDTHVPY